MIFEVYFARNNKFQFRLSRHIGGFKLYLPGLFVAVNRCEHFGG